MSTDPDPFTAPDLFTSPTAATVIRVGELNRRVRALLEARIGLIWVAGELSNVIRAASGHWYFSLKDDQAQVRCVMFRNRASALNFTPEAGQQVEVRVLPSLYEPRGDFQLGVETMRRAGLGALFEAYEKLKAKLGAEGLFESARKKDIPAFPRAIGIVTSLQAAALQDVLTTLQRRAPMVAVVIYPSAVQGREAPREIVNAINACRTRAEVDVLLICRGGGSIEDLWAFNDEAVARAIARLQNETAIAVVSGVGHETDFTITDFVADLRAPTPTAAAELVSPDVDALRASLRERGQRLRRTITRTLDTAQQRLDHAARGLISPSERLARERDRLDLLSARARHALGAGVGAARHGFALLRQRLLAKRVDVAARKSALTGTQVSLRLAWSRANQQRSNNLRHAEQSLSLLDPSRVLERGYSIVECDGVIVRDATTRKAGDALAITLARGLLSARVTENPKT